MNREPVQYPFPEDPEATGYRVFPFELEEDESIYFHGTKDSNRALILSGGFRIPTPPLAQSVSFAKTSSLALRYASEARSELSPAGCISDQHVVRCIVH